MDRKPSSLPSKKMRKHLSPIANDLVQRCAQILDTSVDALVVDFEINFKPEANDYSKRLVEFCSFKALQSLCYSIDEKITDGSLSRLTFDMMLAWESPSSTDEESYSESIAKEKEDSKEPLKGNIGQLNDDIPLFYSDIMPFLVNDDPSVGEDAYVWLASILPLVADVVNARFTYETLTAPTASRLHFPAYDRFLKELDKCIKYYQKQSSPTGFELAKDEVILHVDGTGMTQRVVRHIGATNWPGRLTLTNQALYFEASGIVSYEKALRIDLSNPDVDHQVKAASTGPWGAPLYDKAIIYESSELSEPLVLEFPEITSSTRRDLWLAMIKEVILLHQFISKYNVDSPLQAWEMHARTILGVFRLHAAREMLRIAPPAPTNFLIFSLFDELPKGDYVLEELASSLKHKNGMNPCSATSILKSFNISHPIVSTKMIKEEFEEQASNQENTSTSLETTIDQVREEAREVNIARATVEGLKEEGITNSLLVLVELLSPLVNVLSWFKGILTWERPAISFVVLVMSLVIVYKEWVGYAMAALLMSGVGMMLWARHARMKEKCREIKISTSSDKTTMESIVAAQHSLKNLDAMVKSANITILKIQSILVSRAPKHSEQIMWALTGVVVLLVAVPMKFIIMCLIVFTFMANSKTAKSRSSSQGNRRLREWWDSIPVAPVCTDEQPSPM